MSIRGHPNIAVALEPNQDGSFQLSSIIWLQMVVLVSPTPFLSYLSFFLHQVTTPHIVRGVLQARIDCQTWVFLSIYCCVGIWGQTVQVLCYRNVKGSTRF